MERNRNFAFSSPKKRDTFEKECFDAMTKAGSVSAAGELMALRGFRNTYTGKPYTRMAVYQASIRYMVKNHAEVKDTLFELWRMRGIENISDEEWEEFIVYKAMKYLFSKHNFMGWLEENPWAEKYDYIYAKRFGLRQKNFGNF